MTNAKELGVRVYQATEAEDRMIATWWDELVVMEELHDLVSLTAHCLSAFYRLFQPPNCMIYTEAKGDFESVHWLEPISTSPHAVFFSSWQRTNIRGTKRQAQLALAIYQTIFDMGKQVIVGITKQPQLLKLHEKLGYVILGSIPGLFDGYEGWIMYMTPASLANSRMAHVAESINKKVHA